MLRVLTQRFETTTYLSRELKKRHFKVLAMLTAKDSEITFIANQASPKLPNPAKAFSVKESVSKWSCDGYSKLGNYRRDLPHPKTNRVGPSKNIWRHDRHAPKHHNNRVNEYPKSYFALTAKDMVEEAILKPKLILDSGATRHTTNNFGSLGNIREVH